MTQGKYRRILGIRAKDELSQRHSQININTQNYSTIDFERSTLRPKVLDVSSLAFWILLCHTSYPGILLDLLGSLAFVRVQHR